MSPEHRQTETLLEETTMNSVWASAHRVLVSKHEEKASLADRR
jgi:hypothetical protein